MLLDAKIRSDAKRVSGDNYAAVVELSTRQAFATIEVTGENEDDIMIFLKEISSNGDMSVSFALTWEWEGVLTSSRLGFHKTVDVIFPMYPILTYTNPALLKLLLEPIMKYSVSGLCESASCSNDHAKLNVARPRHIP